MEGCCFRKKKEPPPRSLAGVFFSRSDDLDGADARSLKSFRTFRRFELHGLAVIQGFVTVTLDG